MSIFKNAKVVGNDEPTNKGFGFKPKQEEKVVEEEQNVDSNTNEDVNNEVEQKTEDNNTKENEEKQEVELQRETSNEESENEELQQKEEVVNSDVDKTTENVKVEDDKKEELEIPDDIKTYLKYKEETGRSYQDYLELQRDWKNENEDTVLKRYLKDKNPYFTDEDIKDELSELSYDDDVDDEKDIRKKKREKRKLLSEALNYLESQKETYKQPAEGSSDKGNVEIPDEYKQAKTKLSEIQESQKQQETLIRERQQKFLNETKSVFNEEFKGFEFDINGEKKVFKSDDADKLLNKQSNIDNLIKPFTNEQGEIVDIKGYHKAINGAMYIDKVAKHFYELGQAETIANVTKDSKNINMSGHKTTESPVVNKGIKMRVVEDDSNKSFGWKIRNRN